MPGSLTQGCPMLITGVVANGANFEVTPHPAEITYIKWSAPTTAAHICEIWDKNGRRITLLTCVTATGDLMQQFSPTIPVNGIYIDQMDSGSLEIGIK